MAAPACRVLFLSLDNSTLIFLGRIPSPSSPSAHQCSLGETDPTLQFGR